MPFFILNGISKEMGVSAGNSEEPKPKAACQKLNLKESARQPVRHTVPLSVYH
jgi:hypothetical protein